MLPEKVSNMTLMRFHSSTVKKETSFTADSIVLSFFFEGKKSLSTMCLQQMTPVCLIQKEYVEQYVDLHCHITAGCWHCCHGDHVMVLKCIVNDSVGCQLEM